jgi:hypothetical protein
MSQFSTDWLALREPLDAASRATSLSATVVEALRRAHSHSPRIQVIDLGAGTGANLRCVAPRLGGSQDWLLVDVDPLMLAAVNGRMRAWARSSAMRVIENDQQLTIRGTQFECGVRGVCLDLATQLDRLALPDGALLCASALLDLVSEQWLRNLALHAVRVRAIVWFALTYDGRIHCYPAEPEDWEVRELFNTHQLTDKGFGPALGPTAEPLVEQIFTDRGYRIERAPSDWRIGPTQRTLQHALLDGWFNAACEIAPEKTSHLGHWRARRQAHINGGRSEVIVGHVDMIGCPHG